jgi:ribosomal protein S8E
MFHKDVYKHPEKQEPYTQLGFLTKANLIN